MKYSGASIIPSPMGAVFLGCKNEVAGIQVIAIKQSHLFLVQLAVLNGIHDNLQFCTISKLLRNLTQAGILIL